jgi:preprotein translocase subunit Sec63
LEFFNLNNNNGQDAELVQWGSGKMTRSEYENEIKELGVDLQELNIVIGRKTNVPISTGCYFEDGNWILYNVDERQNFSIIEKGNEDRIFKFLYMITMGKIGK